MSIFSRVSTSPSNIRVCGPRMHPRCLLSLVAGASGSRLPGWLRTPYRATDPVAASASSRQPPAAESAAASDETPAEQSWAVAGASRHRRLFWKQRVERAHLLKDGALSKLGAIVKDDASSAADDLLQCRRARRQRKIAFAPVPHKSATQKFGENVHTCEARH